MSPRIPPLNPLRTFEVAARHLSFTRAADELFVTAAAVSHQIKVLESSLGVKLFSRIGGNLVLTDVGQAYLPAIQQAFRQVLDATDLLHRHKDVSVLKINASPTFSVKWLLPRLEAFFQKHPDIDLKLSTSHHLIDFSREDLDLVIRYGQGNYPGMRSERCFSVEVVPVCSPKLLRDRPKLRHPSDLQNYPLLHDGSDSTHPDWRSWFDNIDCHDVDTSRGPTFWPSHLVIDAAIDGLGVALVKRAWIEQDLASGRLVQLFDISMPVNYAYYISYPEARSESHAIRSFVDWVQSQARQTARSE
ncbi:transcriptional regulator GcvA [Pollutimonas sp. H1-120]|uniref:transcriptional regulator GcvA n=1 Tax=Pollutimonas sp. H1-120 TaxID=3148824 RepID=UPI003B51D29F